MFEGFSSGIERPFATVELTRREVLEDAAAFCLSCQGFRGEGPAVAIRLRKIWGSIYKGEDFYKSFPQIIYCTPHEKTRSSEDERKRSFTAI